MLRFSVFMFHLFNFQEVFDIHWKHLDCSNVRYNGVAKQRQQPVKRLLITGLYY